MAQAEWIKEHVKADNIRFVIHLGDIVETNTEGGMETCGQGNACSGFERSV